MILWNYVATTGQKGIALESWSRFILAKLRLLVLSLPQSSIEKKSKRATKGWSVESLKCVQFHNRFRFHFNSIPIVEHCLLRAPVMFWINLITGWNHLLLQAVIESYWVILPSGWWGTQGKFGYSCAAEAFKPQPFLRQKLLISLPCLRQETLLFDPE